MFCNTVEELQEACGREGSGYPPNIMHFDRTTLEALL